jgi:hypothetical protein
MNYLKIITPPIFCVIIIVFTKMSIYYYPLSFGFIIGLFNWKKHKHNPYFGTILSLIVSNVSFWLAFLCIGIFSEFREFIMNNTDLIIGEDMNIYYLMISVFIIAPILVFFSYKFIFNFPKTKFSLYVMIGCIILLITDFILYSNYLDYINTSGMLPYILWQTIMALAIQLIIHQKVIWEKQKLE